MAVIGLTFMAAACDASAKGFAWRTQRDSAGYRDITGLASACTDCISLSPVVTLGTDSAQGFLEDKGTLDYVVRDQAGRYWVGQRGGVKVYAPDGTFVTAVGRPGQGPLEFEFAQPVQVDASGMVHVLDVRLGRETIVRPDFTAQSDRRIPVGFDAIAPLPGAGNRYVMAQWIATPDRLGLPLHVISGMDILASFGLTPRVDASTTTPARSPRLVAATSDGYVLSSMVDKYLIEAWTTDGARVAGFELPGLNPTEVRPGTWAMDNPPPNLVGDIAPYDERHLVVVTHHRRANWKDLVVERASRSGVPYLDAADGHVASVYRSRVDLLDLNTASVVASTWYEGYLLRFIARDLITRLNYDTDGAPLLEVLEMNFRGAAPHQAAP